VSVLAMSFMTTQAMLRSQDTLYQSGDLDLLLTAPLQPRRVLLAKLCGIVANIVMVFAAFTLPIALPVALLGHPGLFGIPLVLLALALISACVGLAITLFIVRIATPRTARTIAQIVGAFLAAGVFLASQFLSAGPGRESAGRTLVGWLVRHDYGSHGIASLPGRAALGDPIAMVAVLGAAMLVFAGAGALLGRAFLRSYQNAPTRLTRTRGRAKGGIARHFRDGLFATMFAKEARLLRRDPQLAFTIVLRLIYLLPIALPAFTHGRGPPLLPALAFFGVLIAGQLAGSLAWLTVSAEDSPDLIAVAPVETALAQRAKLTAALLLAAPFALVLPLAIALVSPRAAIIALAMTAASALAAGLVELRFQRPAPRKSFGRRREGSFLVGVLTFLMTGLLALGGGYLVYLAG
jgi:ABC-2 type transport system permease protein